MSLSKKIKKRSNSHLWFSYPWKFKKVIFFKNITFSNSIFLADINYTFCLIMTPIIPSLSPLFDFLLPRNISGTDFGTGYGLWFSYPTKDRLSVFLQIYQSVKGQTEVVNISFYHEIIRKNVISSFTFSIGIIHCDIYLPCMQTIIL